MPHPEDNSGLLKVGDEIRDSGYAAGRQACWDELTPRITSLEQERDMLKVAVAQKIESYNTLKAEYVAHLATHAPVETNAQQHVGIQVFPDRADLSYGKDLTGTYNMLKYLGVKNVRGGVGPATTQAVIDWYNKCYDELGIRCTLTVGKPRVPLTAAQWDTTQTIVGKLRGVQALHSWNEPNHNRDGAGPPLTDWQANTIRHGHELRRRFGDILRIGSAQLWSGNKTTHDNDLKSLAAATVTINGAVVRYKDTFEEIVWHLYQSDADRMKAYETSYRGLFGDLPIVCSETGMSTAPNQSQGAASMTEAGQADYIKTHIGMYLAAGHDVFWFELRDEFDPDGTDREDWLGIFRHDGSPKPAADSLKALLAA